MELDTFIKTTLLQIANGVKQANDELKPSLKKSENHPEGYNLYLLPPGSDPKAGSGIAFDIAITTQTEKSGQSGVKAKIAVVEAGIGGEASSKQQDISRIQFTVEVNSYHG